MPSDYIDFTFQLDTLEGDFDEDALDRILDAFIEAVEAEDWCLGGSCGPAKETDEDKVCDKCDGMGVAETVPEERKCKTCNGTGEVEPDAMSKEEWEETYAPVAQGTEQPPPKRQVEGSNPSGSASDPCLRICKLSEDTTYCVACGRTTDQIRQWRDMSEEERSQALKEARKG